MHTGGEPVRIVVSGFPPVPGATILEKRRFARENLDHLRKLLIFEPRGHHDMYGVIPVEPDLAEADIAVLFIHNEGYSTMCGHAVIALGRYAVDQRLVAPKAPVTELAIQCPCGLVRVKVAVEETPAGFVSGAVAFESVPSFAFALNLERRCAGAGPGSPRHRLWRRFLCIVEAGAIGLDLQATPLDRLADAADRITRAVAASVPLDHPGGSDLAFLYGTILTDGGDGAQTAEPQCLRLRRARSRSQPDRQRRFGARGRAARARNSKNWREAAVRKPHRCGILRDTDAQRDRRALRRGPRRSKRPGLLCWPLQLFHRAGRRVGRGFPAGLTSLANRLRPLTGLLRKLPLTPGAEA